MDGAGHQGRARDEESFHYQLQQLENILRELSTKGEPGEDPAWLQEYALRLFEVGEALRLLGTSHPENNPSHKSYR